MDRCSAESGRWWSGMLSACHAVGLKLILRATRVLIFNYSNLNYCNILCNPPQNIKNRPLWSIPRIWLFFKILLIMINNKFMNNAANI